MPTAETAQRMFQKRNWSVCLSCSDAVAEHRKMPKMNVQYDDIRSIIDNIIYALTELEVGFKFESYLRLISLPAYLYRYFHLWHRQRTGSVKEAARLDDDAAGGPSTANEDCGATRVASTRTAIRRRERTTGRSRRSTMAARARR